MRALTALLIVIMLSACAPKPMFPPQVMKDVDPGNIEVKAWKEKSAFSPPHNVQLGGQILTAEQQPDRVLIIGEELPIVQHPKYGPSGIAKHGPPFLFAISFNKVLDAQWLQPGNRFIVVGKTEGVRPVTVDETPTFLPYLVGQCIHLWQTQGREIASFPYETGGGYYSLAEETFCN